MSRIMEEIAKEAAMEATRESQITMAKSLLADGLPIAFVVKHCGLTEEDVTELAAQLSE